MLRSASCDPIRFRSGVFSIAAVFGSALFSDGQAGNVAKEFCDPIRQEGLIGSGDGASDIIRLALAIDASVSRSIVVAERAEPPFSLKRRRSPAIVAGAGGPCRKTLLIVGLAGANTTSQYNATSCNC